ncbi:hypothetical protein GOB99_30370 [Sinorhizobium meliloti]|nr:hypothetical protein [Sinorhizobium meliloti]MDX0240820.1 hypothetical protein [Sinorhizobium meliloti]
MSEHHHRHRSLRDVHCDAANDNATPVLSAGSTGIDAAGLIGLALAYVRQGREGSPSVPVPVMARLDMLADRGDPTCRMVCNWIRSRRTRSRSKASSLERHHSSCRTDAAEIISPAASQEVL